MMACSWKPNTDQMKPSAFDKCLRAVRRREEGVTALEFGLLAPILMSITLFAIQLGLALHKGNTMQWAINKAARAALIDPTLDETGIQAFIDERVGRIDRHAEIDIAYSESVLGSATIAKISGTYYHKVEVPFFPAFTAAFDIEASVPRV